MNQSYIMTLREDSLHSHYEVVKERESKDGLLGYLFYPSEDPMFDVFIKHKSKSGKKVINVVNIQEYLDDKTIGGTYTNTIEKFYVCMQRRSENSGNDTYGSDLEFMAYCLACGNEACTCDPSMDEYLESKVDEMEFEDKVAKADPSVLGSDMLHTKYIHGRYLDYWETIPPYAINKRLINQLAETDRSFVYLQWKDRPDVCYRVTMYTKEMLMQYCNDVEVIYILPDSYDRDPNAVAKQFWLASESAQIIINLIVAFIIFAGIFLGFVINSNAAMITAIFSILVFLFYNVWVSDYINRDRGLSNEAFNKKYGQ